MTKLFCCLLFLFAAHTSEVIAQDVVPVPSECLTLQNRAVVFDALEMQEAEKSNLKYQKEWWPQAPTKSLEESLEGAKGHLAAYLKQRSDDIASKKVIAIHKDNIFMFECYLKHRRGGAKSAPNVQPNKNSRNTQPPPDKLPDIPEPTGDVSKCVGPFNDLSAEFKRRQSTVDTDDIVVNLAMLHWIGPRARDIWQNCDAAVAQAYEKLSVKALEMCLPRTSDPRLCKDPFASRVATSPQPTRGSSDQDPAVEGGGTYAIKAQKPKKTTLNPAARKALSRAAAALHCVKIEPWAVDGVLVTNTCSKGREDQGLNFFWCLVGAQGPEGRERECGGPQFAKWVNQNETSGGAIEHGVVPLRYEYMISNVYGATQVKFFACKHPYSVTNIKWDAKRGLISDCQKCSKFWHDGKNSCAEFWDE